VTQERRIEMFLDGSALLYFGAALMALTVVCTVIAVLVMHRKRKKLDEQLQLEYGPKDGKRRQTSADRDNMREA